MKILYSKLFNAYFLSILTILIILSNSALSLDPKIRKIKIKKVPNLRVVDWCLTGAEPEFQDFPFSQFQYPLRETTKFYEPNPNVKYKMHFWQIENKNDKESGTEFFINKVHFALKLEVLKTSLLGLSELEGLLIQINLHPRGLKIPGANFIEYDKLPCSDCKARHGYPMPCRKRPKISVVHPTVMVWHYLMKWPDTYKHDRRSDDTGDEISPRLGPRPNNTNARDSTIDPYDGGMGKTNEVHGTFEWFYPPCVYTRLLEFQILAVHSFEKGVFFHKRIGPYEFPYEPKLSRTKLWSRFAPTPTFTAYKNSTYCDTEDIMHARILGKEFKFDNSEGMHKCITTDKSSSQFCETIPDFVTCSSAYTRSGWETFTERCEKPCDPFPTTTISEEEMVTTIPLFKRSLHGAIQCFAVFLLLPIFLFIARYYKETYNQHSFRGAKLWLWIHLVGCAFAVFFIYFAYFVKEYVHYEELHTIFGNCIILCIIVTLLFAWARHKNNKMNICAEFFHSFFGYLIIIFGVCCMYTAPGPAPGPGPGIPAIAIMWTMLIIVMLFYLGMEIHVCVMDKRMGVTPSRRHLPIIIILFYDLTVPKAEARIRALKILIFLLIVFFIVLLFV